MKKYYTVYVEGQRARSFVEFKNARKYAESSLISASKGIGHYPQISLCGPRTPNPTTLYFTVLGWKDKPLRQNLIVCGDVDYQKIA